MKVEESPRINEYLQKNIVPSQINIYEIFFIGAQSELLFNYPEKENDCTKITGSRQHNLLREGFDLLKLMISNNFWLGSKGLWNKKLRIIINKNQLVFSGLYALLFP